MVKRKENEKKERMNKQDNVKENKKMKKKTN